MNSKCETCRYYTPENPYVTSHIGECRRDTPRFMHGVTDDNYELDTRGRWPWVTKRDGCGEHKPVFRPAKED